MSKDILPNKDGSVGEHLLLTTDTSATYQHILTTYHQRWGIEDYHKSLKNNASLQKSPAWRVQAQATHLLVSVCAFVKLEAIKRQTPNSPSKRAYISKLSKPHLQN